MPNVGSVVTDGESLNAQKSLIATASPPCNVTSRGREEDIASKSKRDY